MQQQIPCLPTSTGTSLTTATTTPLSGQENIHHYLASLRNIRFHQTHQTTKSSLSICSSAQKERVFAYRAREENLELPQIHLAINNRVIQYALRWPLLLQKNSLKRIAFFSPLLLSKVIQGQQSNGRLSCRSPLQGVWKKTRNLHEDRRRHDTGTVSSS